MKKIKNFAIAALGATLLVAGCASPADRAFATGDRHAGCRLLVMHAPRNADDLHRLGACYERGIFVDQRIDAARTLWSQAARFGHAGAIADLARMHAVDAGRGGARGDAAPAIDTLVAAAQR